MGLIDRAMGMVFGSGSGALRDTIQVFRENVEAGAERDANRTESSLKQFSAEFARDDRGRFDMFMDGVNRIPRPAMALGTLGLFVAAMVDPIWFGERMQGLALVPEPLWWLLGAIVSFYFGSRFQAKGQDFRRDLVRRQAHAPSPAPDDHPAPIADDNPAMADWRLQDAG